MPLRQAAKRYLVDPSLAAAALETSPTRLKADLAYFGLLFKNLVVRDLAAYAASKGCTVGGGPSSAANGVTGGRYAFLPRRQSLQRGQTRDLLPVRGARWFHQRAPCSARQTSQPKTARDGLAWPPHSNTKCCPRCRRYHTRKECQREQVRGDANDPHARPLSSCATESSSRRRYRNLANQCRKTVANKTATDTQRTILSMSLGR